jgi:hypothetical protein
MRFARDIARGTVGGPVNQSDIINAIAGVADVDEVALAGALVTPLSAAILAGLPSGDLTQADVEAAVRNVLRTGTGV